MDVFQCPDCELRFRFASELDQHISLDHPEFEWTPRTIEDSLMAASHRRKQVPEYHPEHS